MSIYETPAHCYNIEEDEEKDDHPWYHDILKYVKNHEYPDQASENDKRMLRSLAINYVLDGEILYKRRNDQVLLRCVDAVEANKILEEVYEGVCGTHANDFTMASQNLDWGNAFLFGLRNGSGLASRSRDPVPSNVVGTKVG
ncbi:uncharacterized protein LOC108477571 [Gossypium arboreum]|uniref:uncharacterized protein LOC108477571 n=1 Tax=Gossypium arboreum TaxID=29729 RepID=UPI0008190170|nr:uncharacterized protein LOC108477571 [Gossypium arboreum]